MSQHGFSESLIPSSRVSIGPGPRDTAPPLSLHVHVPPACTCTSYMYMYFPPYREGKAWNTRQSSPESWPAYLVSGRLIIQLVQGRADTVKSMSTQFDLSDISKFTVIILPTSIILLVKIILFYSLRSRNSHFHYINSAKYHIFHIYTICKFFKNSRKQHISYLLKNHYFWHFSPFLTFWQICQNHPFPQKPKKHHFSPFPHTMTIWRFSPISTKCQNIQKTEF